jgi:hypothetical protein
MGLKSMASTTRYWSRSPPFGPRYAGYVLGAGRRFLYRGLHHTPSQSRAKWQVTRRARSMVYGSILSIAALRGMQRTGGL